ncbi:unnamed protein product [Alopecurus aequalis]
MATAQQVMAAPVHDVKEEEKNHEIIQDPPSAKVEEREFDANVHKNVDPENEQVPASDADEGQRIASEVEAKLAVKPAEAEAKEAKEGQPRAAKKPAEKASAKGAVVPVDDDTDDEVAAPDGVKKPEKATAKWAVVPVDDEVVTPAGDQAPAAAPVASQEVAEAAGEEATKGGKENACEKAHEE